MKLKVFGLGLIVGLLVMGLSLATMVIQSHAQGPAPQWTPLPMLPAPVGDGAAFILANDLYYAGGWPGVVDQRTAAVNKLPVDPLGVEWEGASALPTARLGVAGAFVNGYVYAIGGYDGSSILNRVDSFDGTEWRSETAIPTALNFTAAAAIQDRIYVVGGLPGPVANVWSTGVISDGMLSGWRSETALPRGLITRIAAFETCLYVVGGGDSSTNSRAEVYWAIFGADGAISAWSQAGTLPRPLAFHAVAIDQNILYVLGGETTGSVLNDQVYRIGIDPDTCALVGTWESSPLPGGGNRRLAVASRFGELYVLGGQTASGYTNAVWKASLSVPTPTLTLHKSVALDGDFDYGKLITYTLSYSNPWVHPDGQTGVVITDVIPSGATFETCSAGCKHITATNILSCSIGALPKDAPGDAVTFTVKVPEPKLAWAMNAQPTAHWMEENTTYISSEVIYTIAYTPTVDASDDAVLVTATLPAQLFPLRVYPSGVDYAVQGNTVVWRVPGPIAETGQVSVTMCVLEAFNANDTLTYTAAIEDVLVSTPARTYTQTFALGEDAPLVAASCLSTTNQIYHPDSVVPLYPTLILRNRAWICSNELRGCQPSNGTITYASPLKVFLPLVMRQL